MDGKVRSTRQHGGNAFAHLYDTPDGCARKTRLDRELQTNPPRESRRVFRYQVLFKSRFDADAQRTALSRYVGMLDLFSYTMRE